jgi:hypothetical protein
MKTVDTFTILNALAIGLTAILKFSLQFLSLSFILLYFMWLSLQTLKTWVVLTACGFSSTLLECIY